MCTKWIGKYEVHEDGTVFSHFYTKPRKLKPFTPDNGYIQISLSLEYKKPRKELLHRLVAKLFIPNPQDKCCINHIDGNKHNNSVVNLEWVTYKENSVHSVETGLHKFDNTHKRKLTTADANDIRDNYVPYSKTLGRRAFARKYNVSYTIVSYIIENKTYL